MRLFRYLSLLLTLALAGCALSPHGGLVFIPSELAKQGRPLYRSSNPSNETLLGHSYNKPIPIKGTASRNATIAFENDWTYREMQSFHDQLPPLAEYSPKVQRVIVRQGSKVFDVVTTPCPKGNVHTWYFDITGTPFD